MTTSWAEWTMAAAAVATGVFVAYQSYVLRETLAATLTSNIQERQISVCEEFIVNAALFSFTDKFGTLAASLTYAEINTEFAPQVSEKLNIFNIPELEEGAFDVMGLLNSIEVISNVDADKLKGALDRLRVYSNQYTMTEIDLITSNLDKYLIIRRIEPMDEQQFGSFVSSISAYISNISGRISSISGKCRDVMLGNRTGLI